tara:strand:+ start:204 stop:467 length:264 start_codon:yes stop_codon:yes gene_type:complete
MSKPVLDKWLLIDIIEDHGGPNKRLKQIMEHSPDYGECFNVKLGPNNEVFKKYHSMDEEWFAGDGPDYTGSLGYAIESLYGVELTYS